MKVGIITYHRAQNYGAFLQAYALCRRLNEENDIIAEVIDFRMEKEVSAYKLRISKNIPSYLFQRNLRKVFANSIKQLTLSKESLVSDKLSDFRKMVYGKYDVIIAGSDEIWKIESFRGFPTPYWLIGDLGCRKFSYAASSRSNFSKLSLENLKVLKNAINELEYIGVRDEITHNEVSKYCKEPEKIHMCCDPTFVYEFNTDAKRGINIIKNKTKSNLKRKSILVMTEDSKIASSIKGIFKNEYNLISVFHYHRGYNNISNLSPFEWIDLIAAADLVITSYFHATCFSIINSTPFISIGTAIKSEKLIEVLKSFNLMGNYILSDELEKLTILSEKLLNNARPDYSSLVKEKRESFDEFLKKLKYM